MTNCIDFVDYARRLKRMFAISSVFHRVFFSFIRVISHLVASAESIFAFQKNRVSIPLAIYRSLLPRIQAYIFLLNFTEQFRIA